MWVVGGWFVCMWFFLFCFCLVVFLFVCVFRKYCSKLTTQVVNPSQDDVIESTVPSLLLYCLAVLYVCVYVFAALSPSG